MKKPVVFYHPETGEILNGVKQAILSMDGRKEYLDPVPMEVPVRVIAPAANGMRQLVQELIRQEMSDLAGAMEMETFEEADDFDIEDDPLDPQTPYEKVFDPTEEPKTVAAVRGTAVEGEEPSASPSPTPSNEAGEAVQPPVKRSVSNEPGNRKRTAGHPRPADPGRSDGGGESAEPATP